MENKRKSMWWIIGIVLVLFLLFVFGRFLNTKTVRTIANPNILKGSLKGPAPWGANNNIALRQRLQAIGLPPLSREGTALHTHEHIDISINGKRVSVPADIGIDQMAGFISPIHTHNASGTIHIESPTVREFTLGQFFDVWGVRFTAQCIGGYCTNSEKKLEVYLNGKLYTENPRLLPLKEHDEIFITYGNVKNNKEATTTIPATYAFPQGE